MNQKRDAKGRFLPKDVKGRQCYKTLTGFKGFRRNLTCINTYFELGRRQSAAGKLKLCSNGFHFCEQPLVPFAYYSPSRSVYCSVTGECVQQIKGEDKVVCRHITPNRILSVEDIATAVWEKNKTRSQIELEEAGFMSDVNLYADRAKDGWQTIYQAHGPCVFLKQANWDGQFIVQTTNHYCVAKGERAITVEAFSIAWSHHPSDERTWDYAIALGADSIAYVKQNVSIAIVTSWGSRAEVHGDWDIAVAAHHSSSVFMYGRGGIGVTHESAIVEGKGNVIVLRYDPVSFCADCGFIKCSLGTLIVFYDYRKQRWDSVRVDGKTIKADYEYNREQLEDMLCDMVATKRSRKGKK